MQDGIKLRREIPDETSNICQENEVNLGRETFL